MEAGIASLTLRERVAELRRSDTAQAAGLAVATIFQQLVAVVFTVIFTRILGTDGYGSLAALINFLVILVVPGAALQVAVARQGTLGRFGRGPEMAATLDRWTRHILIVLAGVVVISVLAREPLAEMVRVDEEWAAAAVPVSAAVWLVVCVQRGLLQAERAYRPVALSIVGEGVGRLLGSLVLVGLALDVTGAFLGLLVAWTVIAVVLHRLLRQRLGVAVGRSPHSLANLARNAAIPIAGLVFVAGLQNVDVIMARQTLSEHAAGVYAATTVAAKLVVWVSVGIGLWVVPEATRRAAQGHDPRKVLARALGLVALLAVPSLAIFAAFPRLLLKLAFGADYQSGDRVLLILGLAFALLAATYVTVQFLLGLHRRTFVIALGVVALAEPLLLLSADTLRSFAWRVLAIQVVAAIVLLIIGARAKGDPHAGTEPVL
jgi:O-antigen/teichoic acid export membrane protein